ETQEKSSDFPVSSYVSMKNDNSSMFLPLGFKKQIESLTEHSVPNPGRDKTQQSIIIRDTG
ncbi:Uncharacterized protein DAT39_006602, partial [Clarias magur]